MATETDEVRSTAEARRATDEVFRTSETGRRDTSLPCPRLYLGRNLAKECTLKPNRWVKVGRDDACHVKLPDRAVSKIHFSLRWSHRGRTVEIQDTSKAGVYVNGEALQTSHRKLNHGDCIQVHGSHGTHDFLLDLRPVSLGFDDPREKPRPTLKPQQAGVGLVRKRNLLREELAKLGAAVEAKTAEAFEKEKKFYEVVARRQQRISQDREREEQLQRYSSQTVELEQKLRQSREDWLARLKAENAANEESVRPLVEKAKQLQQRVDRLQFKKAELERTIHPERYAVVDIPIGKAELGPPASKRPRLDDGLSSTGHEGEEEADLDGTAGGATEPSEPEAGAIKSKGGSKDVGAAGAEGGGAAKGDPSSEGPISSELAVSAEAPSASESDERPLLPAAPVE